MLFHGACENGRWWCGERTGITSLSGAIIFFSRNPSWCMAVHSTDGIMSPWTTQPYEGAHVFFLFLSVLWHCVIFFFADRWIRTNTWSIRLRLSNYDEIRRNRMEQKASPLSCSLHVCTKHYCVSISGKKRSEMEGLWPCWVKLHSGAPAMGLQQLLLCFILTALSVNIFTSLMSFLTLFCTSFRLLFAAFFLSWTCFCPFNMYPIPPTNYSPKKWNFHNKTQESSIYCLSVSGARFWTLWKQQQLCHWSRLNLKKQKSQKRKHLKEK